MSISTRDNIKPPKKLVLKECQLDSFEESLEMLNRQFAYLNVSPTGSGKTESTLKVAISRKMHIFVVAPPSVLSNWKIKSKMYGFNSFVGISYHKLRSKNNNPWLTYSEEKDEYECTDRMKKYINNRTLFIFDEVQTAKNADTITNRAAHTIAKEVAISNTGSRIALLSATPYEMPKYSEAIIKMLCIITKDKMYNYNQKTREYVFTGYGVYELIAKCKMIDSETTDKIRQRYFIISKKNYHELCHDLFVNVLRPRYVTAIDPVYPTKLFAYNGYYHLSDDLENKLHNCIYRLKEEVKYSETTEQCHYKKNGMGNIMVILHEIEWILIEIIKYEAKLILDKNEKKKIVIFLWHTDTLNHLAEYFEQYNPRIINGKVTTKNRTINMELFQKNTNECRMMLCHPISGGTGISLDDTHGDYERTIFSTPSFKLIPSAQAMGRCTRMSTKSDANYYCVFPKSHPELLNMVQSMIVKEGVLRECIGNLSTFTPGNLKTYNAPPKDNDTR